MLAYFLFALLILGVLVAFAHLRKSHQKRHWSKQTVSERILLSTAFAGIFQFLFLLPGWIIAISIFGYSDGVGETPLEKMLFGIVTLIANTVIYLPLFYLLIKWLSNYHRRKMAKTS